MILAEYFRGLADPTRLRIVNLLLRGELCGCDILSVLGTSQPNISRHLTYLRHVGLVSDRREANRIFYRLRPDANDLWLFLRSAFAEEPGLSDDLRRLKRNMRGGACSAPMSRKARARRGAAG